MVGRQEPSQLDAGLNLEFIGCDDWGVIFWPKTMVFPSRLFNHEIEN
ncbi:MAG: hypothetical protein RLZZ165_1170 [Bacteroidota bacterium]